MIAEPREEKAMWCRIRTASRSWKRQEDRLCPTVSRGKKKDIQQIHENISQKDICLHLMFIAVLLIIANTWEQLECQQGKNKLRKCGIYMYREFYSVIKKKEILLFLMTLIGFEDIILSEISQTKTNTVWYHLNIKCKKQQRNKQKIKLIDTEDILVIAKEGILGAGKNE